MSTVLARFGTRQARVCGYWSALILGVGFVIRTVVLTLPATVLDMVFTPLAIPVLIFFPESDRLFGVAVGLVEVLFGLLLGRVVGGLLQETETHLAILWAILVSCLLQVFGCSSVH